jgi:hypothetical protein
MFFCGFFGEAEVDIIQVGNGALDGFKRIFGTSPGTEFYVKCIELQKYPDKLLVLGAREVLCCLQVTFDLQYIIATRV